MLFCPSVPVASLPVFAILLDRVCYFCVSYHCPHCKLCRIGKGLGVDFFHVRARCCAVFVVPCCCALVAVLSVCLESFNHMVDVHTCINLYTYIRASCVCVCAVHEMQRLHDHLQTGGTSLC